MKVNTLNYIEQNKYKLEQNQPETSEGIQDIIDRIEGLELE